jgi:hypothetical protein
MAYAITGARIISEGNRNYYTYVRVCEACGKQQPGTNTGQGNSGTVNGSFRCCYCSNNQQIRIQLG